MQPAGTPKLTEQSADVLPKRLLTRLKSIASDMVTLLNCRSPPILPESDGLLEAIRTS